MQYATLSNSHGFQDLVEAGEKQHYEHQVLNMQHHGCGQEERWDPIDETGEIILKFPDGFQARVQFGVFARLDEKEKSFSFEPSHPIVSKIKAYGVEHNIPELTDPVQDISIPEALGLACLAYATDDIEGVHQRIYTYQEAKRDYVILKNFRYFDDKGDACSDDAFWQRTTNDSPSASDSLALVKFYLAKMSVIQKDWEDACAATKAAGDGWPDSEPFVERNVAVYREFWTAPDDIWMPNSIGGFRHHRADILDWITIARRKGGTYVIPYTIDPFSMQAFLIELNDGRPRLTSRDIESGCHMNWLRRGEEG